MGRSRPPSPTLPSTHGSRAVGLTLSGQQFHAARAALSVVILRLHDGSSLRQITGLPPPLARLPLAQGHPLRSAGRAGLIPVR
ncbi:MAG TPA: hypothetical protein VNL71_03480 [Chloroflexota bacterium]|nr:hypothetical protein [Chloroflexota bacterium]